MTRLRCFTLIELMIVIAIVVIVAVIAVPGILETAQTDNQQKAIATLRDYAGAQRDFRDRAVKKIGVPPRAVFARPFAELYRYGEQTLELMPQAFAEAVDQHHGFNGYFFADDPLAAADSDTAFGLFALPCQYKRTGGYVYYVNEAGHIRELDPGEQINDPANYFRGDRHPRNPSAAGWQIAN